MSTNCGEGVPVLKNGKEPFESFCVNTTRTYYQITIATEFLYANVTITHVIPIILSVKLNFINFFRISKFFVISHTLFICFILIFSSFVKNKHKYGSYCIQLRYSKKVKTPYYNITQLHNIFLYFFFIKGNILYCIFNYIYILIPNIYILETRYGHKVGMVTIVDRI